MRPGAKAGLSLKQFWIVMLGLNIGMLLAALDFNIVATAVPIISSEFNAYNNSSWLGTGFLVTFALVLPIYSKLGDIFGRRSMFMVGTIIFILGSGLCGGSKSMDMLIWSRVIQGIGGGGIYGLVNVIVTDIVPLRDVGKYVSFAGLVWAIADVAGPLLGGAFSQYVTWRWCFYLNLCISPISLLITFFFLRIPSPKVDKERIKNFDILGAITLIGGTVCLLLAISWGGNTFAWSDPRVIGCFVGGFALLVIFVVWEHWAKDPLLPPVFLRSRAIIAIFFAEFFYGANLLGMMYYVPEFFQLVYGDSATISGVALLPMMLGLAIGNPIAGWVTSKYGLSLANAWVGSVLVVLISGLLTRWNAGTSRAEAIVELIIIGIGQGAVMEGLLVGSQFSVEPMHIGLITGLVIFTQTVGDIFGIAIFAAVYQNELRANLGKLSLTSDQINVTLADVQKVKTEFSGTLYHSIIKVYAKSLQNGWWWLFACAACLLISSALAKQRKI
ncbi:MDR family MFS transporter [Aspergillus ibericus CBS 121593]|uniref:Putative efflux pump antibiotic resistance protein n=1 Tax=Aspergillus ibericus CBS 121593 TaxID=1448316 RepID=A0A395GZV6_9EURO|nr:putative efflux pump antibiotic resistance protein [Aspergillus ibericus CBS 121593]RAL01132.1 putative efflux pump antibiotic resistance protein [Aspergillus ibericus CBS 121593]